MYHPRNEKKKSANRPLTSYTYAGRWVTNEVSKSEFPENSMDARAAYQLIHDEMNLDGNPALNLASFVTTWMEEEAEKIIIESLNKNYIDSDEYPQTQMIHDRIIKMMGNLFHASEAVGTATVGSSEAIMLALLAHKWNWRNKRKAAGQEYSNPNIIFGGDVHSCWEKFALYFDVEMRIIPLELGKYVINANMGMEEPLADVKDALRAMDLCFKTIKSINNNKTIIIKEEFYGLFKIKDLYEY